jgi:hypothetical protein
LCTDNAFRRPFAELHATASLLAAALLMTGQSAADHANHHHAVLKVSMSHPNDIK